MPALRSRPKVRHGKSAQTNRGSAAQFVLQDAAHSEVMGTYNTLQEAQAELRRLSKIAWDEPPNRAPCGSWRTCGREYEILEFDAAGEPSKLLRRQPGFSIDAQQLVWNGPEPA